LPQGAPEVSLNIRYKTKGLSLITSRADIFSLGAVLSTAAAWVVGGSELRQEYFEERKKSHAQAKKFRDLNLEGCFHDGIKKLPAVEQMHSRIRKHCKREGWDKITPQVLDIVEEDMLLPQDNKRTQAITLLEKFGSLIHSEPSSPVSVTHPTLHRRSIVPQLEEDVDNSMPTSPESIQRINTFFDSKPVDSTVKNLVDQITRNLRDRDQFFFIDDSTSMKKHQKVVLEGFKALCSIAKRLDPNKIELAFASRPRCVHRAHRTKKLVKLLENHEFQQDPMMMESSLSQLIEKEIIPKLPIRKLGINLNPRSRKRVSVYIFTDGDWGEDPDGACRVERPVEDLMHEILDRKLSRNQVTLHFVRFGDSVAGGRHLDFLDHFGDKLNW
jgi:hypothetical protein